MRTLSPGRAKAVYGALKIRKEEIERRQPWQGFIETAFNVQRRMADWHLSKEGSWVELVAAHDRFVEDYNAQSHFAHRDRPGGRRSRGGRPRCGSTKRR